MQDLKDTIIKGLGFNTDDDVKITGFDPREAEVGHSVEYQFDLEIDHKVIPFKLLEDVKRWDYVDLPIFRAEAQTGLVPKRAEENGLPVLAPFMLAGPMELWIHDANDMRISLPVSPNFNSAFPFFIPILFILLGLKHIYGSIELFS